MALQTPLQTAPSPVAEHQARSARGVTVLMSGIVALLAGAAVLWCRTR
jgi:hypothetical protein